MSDLPNARDLDADYATPSTEDVGPPVQNTVADLPGQLKEWLGGVAGRMGGWATDAATIVNDFITRRDIADNATAQAQAFTQSTQAFARGLDEVVRADPTATNMALGLAALTVPAIVDDHPYLPAEHRGAVAHELAGEIGRGIARNAVVSWAQRDTDTAHAELKRLGGLFPEDERAALGAHVDLLGAAREQDAAAAAIQEANDRANESQRRSMLYADQLVRPDGTPQFPPGWMRRVVNDQNVSPEDTARMMQMQTRMQNLATQYAGTPPPLTNGTKITEFLGMAQGGRAEQSKLLDHVGVDLDLKDAQTLMAAAKNPAEADYLRRTMDQAARAVKGPDGDLDPTGETMARFAKVFLNEYRTLGRGALDPNSPNFLGSLRGFAGKDEMNARIQLEQKADKLQDIFAKRMADKKADAARQGAMYGLREQLTEAKQEERDARQEIKQQDKFDARAKREELRALQAEERARFAAEHAAWRLEEERRPHGPEHPSMGGGRTRAAERTSEPTDTFRRFLGIGRPERA